MHAREARCLAQRPRPVLSSNQIVKDHTLPGLARGSAADIGTIAHVRLAHGKGHRGVFRNFFQPLVRPWPVPGNPQRQRGSPRLRAG